MTMKTKYSEALTAEPDVSLADQKAIWAAAEYKAVSLLRAGSAVAGGTQSLNLSVTDMFLDDEDVPVVAVADCIEIHARRVEVNASPDIVLWVVREVHDLKMPDGTIDGDWDDLFEGSLQDACVEALTAVLKGRVADRIARSVAESDANQKALSAEEQP